MTEDEIVGEVQSCLRLLTMNEIYRCLRLDPAIKMTAATPIPTDAAKVGAFILACCLLETISGFCFRNGGQSGFEQICTKYLDNINPKYKSLNLYGALRSGLMHSYAPVEESKGQIHKFWLTDGHEECHLQPIEGQEHTYVLNLQNFVVDIQKVLEQFLAKLPENEDRCRDNLLKWAEQKGWMSISSVDVAGVGGVILSTCASGSWYAYAHENGRLRAPKTAA